MTGPGRGLVAHSSPFFVFSPMTSFTKRGSLTFPLPDIPRSLFSCLQVNLPQADTKFAS
jgi:hypothetical protein